VSIASVSDLNFTPRFLRSSKEDIFIKWGKARNWVCQRKRCDEV
jgi:hypothetical protein